MTFKLKNKQTKKTAAVDVAENLALKYSLEKYGFIGTTLSFSLVHV